MLLLLLPLLLFLLLLLLLLSFLFVTKKIYNFFQSTLDDAWLLRLISIICSNSSSFASFLYTRIKRIVAIYHLMAKCCPKCCGFGCSKRATGRATWSGASDAWKHLINKSMYCYILLRLWNAGFACVRAERDIDRPSIYRWRSYVSGKLRILQEASKC